MFSIFCKIFFFGGGKNKKIIYFYLYIGTKKKTATNILLTTWMSFTINDTPISPENWTQILISQQIVFLELFSWPLFKSCFCWLQLKPDMKKINQKKYFSFFFLWMNVNQFHIKFFKRNLFNNFTIFFFIRLSITVAALAAAAGGVN